MKLIGTLTSPFVRKVRVVLAEKKIDYTLIEDSPWSEASTVSAHNPLGKIPVLVMEDGGTLFDSRVIVEYLDTVSPVGRLLPDPGRARIAVKRWEALADGVSDATAAIVVESRREAALRSESAVARQVGKIVRGLDEMARDLADRAWCNGDAFSLADVAVGVALGYLDLRRPGFDWRREHPNLGRLFDKLSRRPSFAETAPPAG